MSSEVLKPLASAEFISRFAKSVRINELKLQEMCEWLKKRMSHTKYDLSSWKKHELHPKIADSSAIDWIFVVDALNFSFWSEDNNCYSVTFDGHTFTGYWSLCAAINRALSNSIPITNPSFYANLKLEQLQHILRGDQCDIEIPLLQQRLRVLQDTGRVLLQKFDGSFANCVKQANNSAEKLLMIIANNFDCFRDEAIFQNKKVSFYKRAQILIADVWACFEGQNLGYFEDIDVLTMFADYRIPQVLAYYGVLEYSEILLKRLNANEIMKNGDPDEIEIRGLSILAIDKMTRKLRNEQSLANSRINSVILDYFLWDYRRECGEKMENTPFHKVRSIFY